MQNILRVIRKKQKLINKQTWFLIKVFIWNFQGVLHIFLSDLYLKSSQHFKTGSELLFSSTETQNINLQKHLRLQASLINITSHLQLTELLMGICSTCFHTRMNPEESWTCILCKVYIQFTNTAQKFQTAWKSWMFLSPFTVYETHKYVLCTNSKILRYFSSFMWLMESNKFSFCRGKPLHVCHEASQLKCPIR